MPTSSSTPATPQASDIDALILLVQERVHREHGITLHTEVKRLGFEGLDVLRPGP